MVSLSAFAKINLDLRILDVRPDGYHEVRTVLQSIELHDTVTCRLEPGPLVIECSDPTVPTDARNLAWRAAAAVWSALGRDGDAHGVRIRLEKRIPAEAGLGGGSADAAAVVAALPRVWRGVLAPDAERDVLAGLGADVPFMARGGTAVGEGRGERLRDLPDLPPHWVVLAKPAFGVATAAAYRWFDEAAGERTVDRAGGLPRFTDEWTEWLPCCRNNLEPEVVRRHPAVGLVLARLRALKPRMAAMSGSGAAVFGLFEHEVGARAAVDRLADPGVWTCLTKTRGRDVSPL